MSRLIKIVLLFLSFNLYAFSIYPEVFGTVNFHKLAGDNFKQDEVLISIDATDVKLTLEFEKTLLDSYAQELADKELALEKEQELYDRLVVSKKSLDRVKLEFVYAQNQYKIQQAKVAIAKNNLHKYQIKAPFAGKVKSVNLLNAVNQNYTKELMILEKN
jgi:multidrug efflux pump subunit AcrA (membrane-fusion protein)